MTAARTVLRWFRPWRYASGLLFGFLFGVVWFLSLCVAIGGFEGSHKIGPAVFFGTCWALVWGLSGLVCQTFPNYWGTIATTLAVVYGNVQAITEGRLGGWTFVVVPFYTAAALLPCHWLMVLIAAIRGRVE
jgi:hypothetical protein